MEAIIEIEDSKVIHRTKNPEHEHLFTWKSHNNSSWTIIK